MQTATNQMCNDLCKSIEKTLNIIRNDTSKVCGESESNASALVEIYWQLQDMQSRIAKLSN
jgi:hypothetical protein